MAEVPEDGAARDRRPASQRRETSDAYQLAEFVMDQLSGSLLDAAVGAVMAGLVDIGNALDDVQERRGDWETILATLLKSAQTVRTALGIVRGEGGDGFAGFARFAERQGALATAVADEIARLQVSESYLAQASSPSRPRRS